MNHSTEQPPELTAERLDRYIGDLFTNWCECSPYGEQVPDEWPELMAQFVKVHAGKDRDLMAELIADGNPDDCFEKLLESIFATACHSVIRDLTESVHDENAEKLSVIGYSHSSSQLHSLRSELATAKERIGELEKQRSDLNDESSTRAFRIFALESDLHEAQATIASQSEDLKKLRICLAFVLASAHPHPTENVAMYSAWQEGDKVLAETLPTAPEKQEGGVA
jgi:hypothetical protein